jgi:AP-1 complex subunit gamma-1
METKCSADIFSDLNHSNQYIVGLALVTLGNIASVEMSRDLFPEVETILSSSNPYIRRKAAICAMRICRKVPDLQEHFLDKAKTLISDRNHGVLLCGLTLVTSMCEADEAEDGENGVVELFRPQVPSLVKIVKSLANAGYTPEHDVNGISDPFVQVKILQLFRVLARGDAQTSEQINDILAQVCTLSNLEDLDIDSFKGCYEYRWLEECRQLHSLRGCPDNSRH